ncbi:hypothetical protein MMC2321_02519 [Chitinophaga sp. MM2321]
MLLGLHLSLVAVAQSSSNTGKVVQPVESANLNITPFGSIRSWYKNTDTLGKPVSFTEFATRAQSAGANIGVFWWDARDITAVEVIYQESAVEDVVQSAQLQYWKYGWPDPPPHMPSMDDHEDDPWRGHWVTAQTNVTVKGKRVIYTFKPLNAQENNDADNLPGVTYRRTLKVRVLFPQPAKSIAAINVLSTAKARSKSIRIQMGCGNNKSTPLEGSLEIFNGYIKNVAAWNWDRQDKKTGMSSWKMNLNRKEKGIVADIFTAEETLPGSNTETVVTVRSNLGTFSFSPDDLEKGPIYIPHYNAYITRSADPVSFAKANPVQGKTIREKILEEPEQSYERALAEIPPLDPFQTQDDERIYIPLATDANWQKFMLSWGGNIIMDKKEVRAQGKELLRCNWEGLDLKWNIGSGAKPDYLRTRENSKTSMLEGYIPVVNTKWRQDSLIYDEEVFTTLLHGPLSPDDPARSEQTPAILLVKVTVSNPALKPRNATVWLSANEAVNGLTATNGFIMDEVKGGKFIRAYMPSGPENVANTTLEKDDKGANRSIRREIALAPNSSKVLYYYFPFVGDLTVNDEAKLAALNYENEKERVVSYWRDIVAKNVVYNVPEPKFNDMSRAVVPHIRMGTTKDPKSGLYMVPAAAIRYMVFPNESVFQTNLLNRLGDFSTAGNYLNTFMALQGSRKLPGDFTGDQKDVLYGVKVAEGYDLTGIGYNMHHGTVLWGLAHHYLYAQDKAWLKKAAPHMARAANWIIEQRNNTKQLDEHGDTATHYGLMPAGSLEDVSDWRFWYATNAYSYLGLETMAKAFESAGLPEAAYYRKEAAAYYKDIRRSLDRATELSPVVRLRNGTYVPYVPTRPYQRFRYFGPKKAKYYDRYNKGMYPTLRLTATREALYGPVVLLKTGVVEPAESMGDWILNDWEDNITLSTSLNLNTHGWVDDEYWFSRGGMVFQANLQNPVGAYLQRQEIPAALRNLYNDFVSCFYPDVNVFSEEYRMWKHGSGPFYKAPDEARFVGQICDLLVMESGEELWLANGTPQRWLEPGNKIMLNNAHTEYGKMSYTLQSGQLPGTIEADITLPEKKCEKVLLFVRAPFKQPIRAVTINGKVWQEWDAKREAITIPQTNKKVHVTIVY